MRTAQLFFGYDAARPKTVSEAAFTHFVEAEITPRFPHGLTVMQGGGEWSGAENRLIREASKVVLIVLPKSKDVSSKIDAVREAYKKAFNQDSVLLITQAACVAL